jgi:predicted RNase H-like nuclease (RuvC/YqgF family)
MSDILATPGNNDSNSNEQTDIDLAIERANELFSAFVNSTIVFYWSIGELLSKLDRKYGTNSVENFSKQLAAKKDKPVEIDKSTLYRALKFNQNYSAAERDKMIAAGISWSQIQKTLASDPTVVVDTVDKVIEGVVEPTRFADAVKQVQDVGETAAEAKQRQQNEISKEEPTDELGSLHGLVRSIQKNIKNLDALLESLPDLFIVFKDKWDNLSKEDKRKYKELVSELHVRLEALRASGGPVFELIKEKLAE